MLGAPDLDRADALCDYLVEVHSEKADNPGLYVRRIRELVGHGECIMGIVDAYPEHPWITEALLARIEHDCLDWRWKLRSRVHRLRQIHGDFHPWNILFRSGVDFTVLDRSRGECGDPADDVASLTMNYLSFPCNAVNIWRALLKHCSCVSGNVIWPQPAIVKCCRLSLPS
jgi:hypothetical protein